jgi:transposase
MKQGDFLMHYLGIDWANDKHDLCLLADDGRILSQFVITHDLAGFVTLQDHLKTLSDVRINIERSDGLLVDWLVQQGYNLFITPPHILAHRRPTRVKDDKGDAYLLAYLLRLDDRDCRPYSVQSHIVMHLRQLIRAYDHALSEQRRMSNQLIYSLRQYYPAALNLFTKIYTLIGLAFLERYPTPQHAQALSREELEQFLRGYHYAYPQRIDIIYRNLKTPMPLASVQDGHVEYVKLLIPLLRMVYHHKNALIRQIRALFNAHPEANWWLRFPGTTGPLTPARMLAWIGDDRSRFPTAESLQAVAGTVPVTRRSGKSKSVEFRTACSHTLRSAVDDLARQSMRHSSWARAYFQQQLDNGHSVPRAYRALGNRWLKIIWTLWQSGEVYDELKHIANRSRKGAALPLAQAV